MKSVDRTASLGVRRPAAPRSSPPVAGWLGSPSVLSLIGRTPLLPLHFRPEGVTLHVKCEFLNPGGSIKDRFALGVLANARRRGLLRPGAIILECSSGNTGIALALVGAALGHRVRILMSDTACVARQDFLRQLGAEVQLFPPDRGYVTGIELAEKMGRGDPRYFLPRQFENPLNALGHREHTGAEILGQLDRRVDAFVSGYGTGGTLNGVSRALRAVNPAVRVVAMEPAESSLPAGESPCCHGIEGVARGYVPPLLKGVTIDGVEKVPCAAAVAMAHRLATEFGLAVGSSSGANVVAALRTAVQLPRHARVVTVLCDRAQPGGQA